MDVNLSGDSEGVLHRLWGDVRGLALIAVLELIQNEASREPKEMTDLLGKQGSLV